MNFIHFIVNLGLNFECFTNVFILSQNVFGIHFKRVNVEIWLKNPKPSKSIILSAKIPSKFYYLWTAHLKNAIYF